jgi:hypothetical protein
VYHLINKEFHRGTGNVSAFFIGMLFFRLI